MVVRYLLCFALALPWPGLVAVFFNFSHSLSQRCPIIYPLHYITYTFPLFLSLSLSPTLYTFLSLYFLEIQQTQKQRHQSSDRERDNHDSMGSSSGQSSNYDLSFKILLIGDSAVGKSSLLVSFISNSVEDLSPTIGTFFFFFFFLIIFPVFNDLKCKIFDKANVIFRFLSNKTEFNTVGSMTRFLSLSNGKKISLGV